MWTNKQANDNMHANKMRLNKLNDSVLTVNYTVEYERESQEIKKTETQKCTKKVNGRGIRANNQLFLFLAENQGIDSSTEIL